MLPECFNEAVHLLIIVKDDCGTVFCCRCPLCEMVVKVVDLIGWGEYLIYMVWYTKKREFQVVGLSFSEQIATKQS